MNISFYSFNFLGGFTGPNLPGIGGPAMELKAVGALKIGESISSNYFYPLIYTQRTVTK